MTKLLSGVCVAFVLAAGLSGCARGHSKVAVVNIVEIEQAWPKFINYYNQLQANYVAIRDSKESSLAKRQAYAQLQQQSQRWEGEVTNDVRQAVNQIAVDQHYELVVTRQGIAYGGDDITEDVERSLKIPITSPSPGK